MYVISIFSLVSLRVFVKKLYVNSNNNIIIDLKMLLLIARSSAPSVQKLKHGPTFCNMLDFEQIPKKYEGCLVLERAKFQIKFELPIFKQFSKICPKAFREFTEVRTSEVVLLLM